MRYVLSYSWGVVMFGCCMLSVGYIFAMFVFIIVLLTGHGTSSNLIVQSLSAVFNMSWFSFENRFCRALQ